MKKVVVLIFLILVSGPLGAMNQCQEELFVMNLANIVHRQRNLSVDSVSNEEMINLINEHKTDTPFINDVMKTHTLSVDSINLTSQENQLTLTMTSKDGMKFQYVVSGNRYTKKSMNFVCIANAV